MTANFMQLNKISRAESSFSKELCQFSKQLGLLNKTVKNENLNLARVQNQEVQELSAAYLI